MKAIRTPLVFLAQVHLGAYLNRERVRTPCPIALKAVLLWWCSRRGFAWQSARRGALIGTVQGCLPRGYSAAHTQRPNPVTRRPVCVVHCVSFVSPHAWMIPLGENFPSPCVPGRTSALAPGTCNVAVRDPLSNIATPHLSFPSLCDKDSFSLHR